MQKKYWRSHCLRSFVRAEGQWFGQYLLAASDRASGLPTEITRAGSVDTQLLETHRAPHSGGPPLGLMSRWWCHLEVRRTVIFTPVFWKWGPVGAAGRVHGTDVRCHPSPLLCPPEHRVLKLMGVQKMERRYYWEHIFKKTPPSNPKKPFHKGRWGKNHFHYWIGFNPNVTCIAGIRWGDPEDRNFTLLRSQAEITRHHTYSQDKQ